MARNAPAAVLVFVYKRPQTRAHRGSAHLWTPLNVILFNLVCSDFSVALLGNPLTLAAAVAHRWIFGRTMCVIYGFFMSLLGMCHLTMYIIYSSQQSISSIATLTVLAFERYVMISRPFQARRLSRRGAALLVAAIWVYSLLLTAPPLLGWGDYVHEAANISCSVNWESRTLSATSYIVFLFAMGLVVPVAVISFSYLNIVRTLKQNTLRSGRATRAESRVALMVAVMIAAFLVAWTPYSALALLIAFGDHRLVSPGLAVVPALVAKSSICYNPLIYVGLNTQFRSAWRRLLGVQTPAPAQSAGQEVTFVSPTRGCSHSGLALAGTTTLLAVSAAASSTLLLHQDAMASQKAPLPLAVTVAGRGRAEEQLSEVPGAADSSQSAGQVSSSNHSSGSSNSSSGSADTLLLAPRCAAHPLQEAPPPRARRPTVRRKWSATVVFEKAAPSEGSQNSLADTPSQPAACRGDPPEASTSPTRSEGSGNDSPKVTVQSSRNDEPGRSADDPDRVAAHRNPAGLVDGERALTGVTLTKNAWNNETEESSLPQPSHTCNESDCRDLCPSLDQNVSLSQIAPKSSNDHLSGTEDPAEGLPSVARTPGERHSSDHLAIAETPNRASDAVDDSAHTDDCGSDTDVLSGPTVPELAGGSTWSLGVSSKGDDPLAEPAVSALVLSASRCASRAVLSASVRDNNNSRDVPSRYSPDEPLGHKELRRGHIAEAGTLPMGALWQLSTASSVSDTEAIELKELITSNKPD